MEEDTNLAAARSARLSLLDALLKVAQRREELFAIVEREESFETAKAEVAQIFEISREAADHVLTRQIHQYTRQSVTRWRAECDELRRELGAM